MKILNIFKKKTTSSDKPKESGAEIIAQVPISFITEPVVPLDNVFERYLADKRIFEPEDTQLNRRWETFKPSRKPRSRGRRSLI